MDIIKNKEGRVIATVAKSDYPLKHEVQTENGIVHYLTVRSFNCKLCINRDITISSTMKNIKADYLSYIFK